MNYFSLAGLSVAAKPRACLATLKSRYDPTAKAVQATARNASRIIKPHPEFVACQIAKKMHKQAIKTSVVKKIRLIFVDNFMGPLFLDLFLVTLYRQMLPSTNNFINTSH
mgnify:CR=1 FL=1